MTKRGEVYENPVTGERAVICVGTAESGGERLMVDLYLRPGARVAAPHYHPALRECFTIESGTVGVMVDGRRAIVGPRERVVVEAGVVHDWWNAGETEARVRVVIEPGARFEAMILNLFGLAQDGRTDARGMPRLLQLVLLAQEFDDVIRFVRPPRLVQRLLFPLLAPLARWRGYRGSYASYLTRLANEVIELDHTL
jgi:mannose-6-phosphate isomerase-like protein (cupin superfamily)